MPPEDNLPKIGSIVHYVNYHGDPGGLNAHRPGMITGIWYVIDPDCVTKDNLSGRDLGYGAACVDLAIFTPAGMFFNKHVSQDEINRSGGTWHWPED